jgi:hypothetical protein
MPTLVYRDTGVSFQRIRNASPTTIFTNTGSEQPLEATVTSVNRQMCKFPITAPGGAVTVTSATLTLYNLFAVATSRTVEMRAFTEAWDPLLVSWNRKSPSPINWTVPGVIGGPEIGAVIATGTAPAAGSTAFNITGAGLIAHCQSCLNSGTDFGFLLNLLDDVTVSETGYRAIAAPTNVTASLRPTLTIDYTTGTPVNWTINSPTVNSDAGTVTLTVTLDAPAPGGGFSGLVNTYDITAVAGVDYTAQVDVPFSISAGNTTGNIVIPILP